MLCDSHIHIGEFYNDLYFSPKCIASWFLENEDIEKFLFIQTSRRGAFPYDEFLREADEVKALVGNAALPALWLPLEKFKTAKNYIKDDFVALKFHPSVEDNLQDKDFDFIMKVARDFNKPLIIHTSFDYKESCTRLAPICEQNPDTKIILAHCRPFEDSPQALSLPNVYADTAYMPPVEAGKLVKLGFGNKLLFGSDFPIDKHFFPNENELLRYKDFKNQMKQILPKKALSENFKKLFT